jgi:hypothetical protein
LIYPSTPKILPLVGFFNGVSGSNLFYKFVRTWRNWHTRTAQDRMGQPLRVQLSSSAPLSLRSAHEKRVESSERRPKEGKALWA